MFRDADKIFKDESDFKTTQFLTDEKLPNVLL